MRRSIKTFVSEVLEETQFSQNERKLIRLFMGMPMLYGFVVKSLHSALEEAAHDTNAIDWENFPWEEAKDFWVPVIEAIGQVILMIIKGV